jgi:nicotinamide-nucleotide amidase
VSGRSGIEVVAIGDELLLGDTIDTNGAWLGQRLAGMGLRVMRRSVVGDDEKAIRSAVEAALARVPVVICSGGLGPTPDDRTRAAVAGLYGWPLEVDESWLAVIRERFTRRGMVMPLINRVQAEVPRGATLVRNEVGTAPGLILDSDKIGLAALLPGVPSEFRWLMEHGVIEHITRRSPPSAGRVQKRVLRVTGIAESALAERIADVESSLAPLTLAYLPTGTSIDLRLTCWGDLPEAEAGAALDTAEQKLAERLGPLAWGRGDDDLATLLGEALRARGLRIAVAESCTGGLVAKRLTDAAGASDYMLAGVITYSNESKQTLLGVDPALFEAHGAVSEAVAGAMLEGVRVRTGATCAISVTGVAGPGGGTAEKPVGTVWIGAAAGERTRVSLYRLFGTRAEIRARACQAALKQLFDLLRET